MTNLRATQTGSGWDVDDTKAGPVSAELDGNGRPTGRMLDDRGQVVAGAGSMAERAAARYASKFRPGISEFIGNGDSYGANSGASVGTNGFMSKLMAYAATKGLVASNFSLGSTTVARMTLNAKLSGASAYSSMWRLPVTNDMLFAMLIGLNDLRGAPYVIGGTVNAGCGPSGEALRTFRARLMYMVAHHLIPETQKVRSLTLQPDGVTYALNPDVQYTGTWTVGNVSAAVVTAASCTTGTGSATFTTGPGDLIVYSYFVRKSTDVIGQDIVIDGVSYGSLSANCDYEASYAPTCRVFRVPYAESHTVTVTRNAAAVLPEHVACVDTTQDFGATMMYATPVNLLDAAGVGWSSGNTLNGIEANSLTGTPAADLRGSGGLARMAATIHEVMAQMHAWGFNVFPVEVNAGFDPRTMLSADNLHPNDAGHNAIYTPFARAIDTLIGR